MSYQITLKRGIANVGTVGAIVKVFNCTEAYLVELLDKRIYIGKIGALVNNNPQFNVKQTSQR